MILNRSRSAKGFLRPRWILCTCVVWFAFEMMKSLENKTNSNSTLSSLCDPDREMVNFNPENTGTIILLFMMRAAGSAECQATSSLRGTRHCTAYALKLCVVSERHFQAESFPLQCSIPGITVVWAVGVGTRSKRNG